MLVRAVNPDNAIVWNLAETDIETYSEGVQNELQDCDINNLIESKVEYTTRSDWTKGWTPVEAITPTEAMMVGLTNSNYELTENGDGVTWGADNGLSLLDFMEVDEDGNCIGALDIDDPKWDELLDQITLDEAIQFIEKGGDDVENIDSIMLTRNYSQDGPVGFAFDQVAGYFVRWSEDMADEPTYTAESDEMGAYSMATMPTEPIVAATFNTELAQREGELFGEDALWANISSIFAPGVNLHRIIQRIRSSQVCLEAQSASDASPRDLCLSRSTSHSTIRNPTAPVCPRSSQSRAHARTS